MINEEVKHIIEPELGEDEELLWAEKTSLKKFDDLANAHKTDKKLFKIGGISLSVIVLPFIIFFPEFRVWGFFLLLTILVSTLINMHTVSNEIETVTSLDIGGYALTNRNFFTFNKSLSSWHSVDASKLTKVVESGSALMLSYGGKMGFFNSKFLQFLPNNYATAKYINTKLGK